MITMLFSVSFKSSHKQEADEIKCPVNQLGLVYDFMKNNPDKRYNIKIYRHEENWDKAIEQINIVKKITSNYTVQCESIIHLRRLLKEGYNAYLRFPVVDWETFTNLRDLGVSDIYIDGPLGFQYDDIKTAKLKTKIRVSPTISPNSALSTSANANTFFIRPEDLSLYDGMIDIIDFNEAYWDREDTLFTIYKRGTFDFDLKELIQSLNMSVPNMFIRPDFARLRLNCGQRCKRVGRPCHSCETQFTLTNKVLSYFNKSN